METQIVKSQEITIVAIQGKLDGNSSNALQQELFALIDGGATKIVIDAAHLSYVASAGLRTLLAAGKKVKGVQGKILLCNVNEMVREVFEISGFAPLFPAFGSRDEAAKAF